MPRPTLRKDGRWMLQLPRSGTRRRCIYGRSPEECEKRYLAAMGAGTLRVRPDSISEFVVLDFVPWLRPRVALDTFRRYDLDWRTMVGPKLGHRLFSELTPEMVQDALVSAGKGASSQLNAKSFLLQLMRLAVAQGKASPAVLTMVQLVRIRKPGPKQREDMAVKAALMFQAAQRLGHWTEGFLYAAQMLGCRKGELCAIKRGDVDARKGTLTIQRQRNHTAGEREQLKHRAAGETRVIGLPPSVLEQLLAYFRPGAIYLVTREDGSPPPTNHFERYLAPVEAEAGVKMTPHDFRSAAICNLLDAGVDDHTIEDLIGHSSRNMIRWYRDRKDERTRGALARLASSDNQ